MKTKHRQASKAKRRWQTDPTSLARFISRFQPFSQAEVNNIVLPPRVAFESMRNGQGTPQDFGTLADAINITLARSKQMDALCIETCNLAINSMRRTHERYMRIGRYGFDGPALLDIALVLDLFDQFVKLGTPQQLFDAISAVKTGIRLGNVHDLEGVAV
jgi:hypothetical protein